MVFLPNNNRIVQIQTICASYHVLAENPICGSFAKITLPFLVFLAITQLLLPIKGGIGELSNKAVTDFEIAKNLLDFPSF
jgi:hypothetical protein